MNANRSLAAAQTVPIRGDVAANIDEHLRLARLASEEHPQVLVFPELSLTGYELDLGPSLAFSENDARLAPLTELAPDLAMTLVVGAPIRIGPNLHVGAFIIRADGGVDVYTKHHLGAFDPSDYPEGPVPPPEKTFFTSGDRNPLVDLGNSSAAAAVCADTGQPAHAQAAADRGATSYLASAFSIPADIPYDVEKFTAYSKRHSMAVVFANFGGPTGGLPAGGCSAIWSDEGAMLIQLGPVGAGVAVATEEDGAWRTRTLAPA